MHRLDAKTSGCFLLARHVDAAAWLSRAFRTPRAITKQYWAVVDTSHHNGDIGDSVAGAHGVVELPGEMTEYTILAVNTQAQIALLKMYPITGRKHQLRRHAALQLGANILGDEKYERALVEGGERGDLDGSGVDANQFKGDARIMKDRVGSKPMYLHCHSLTIHNNSGGEVHITAPPPSYWSSLFHRMGWKVPASV